MAVIWSYSTILTGGTFLLPRGDYTDVGSSIIVFASNTVPLVPGAPASIILNPGGHHSTGDNADDNGFVSVMVSYNVVEPGLWADIWAQPFSVSFTAPYGTAIDIVVQSGSSIDDGLPIENDPWPPTIDETAGLNKPSNFVAKFVSDHIHLTWKDNSNNETAFVIERLGIDLNWYPFAVLAADTVAFDDSYSTIITFFLTLPSDTPIYRIYARNSFKRTVDVEAILQLAPPITINPSRGGTLGGDPIIITGDFAVGTTVYFDGVQATAVVLFDGGLFCTTPIHAEGTVDVLISQPGEDNVTLSDSYTYSLTVSIPGPNAGSAQIAMGPLPSRIRTNAHVTRGQNNGTLTYHWAADSSNPGGVLSIDSPDSLQTTITFTTYVPGTYLFLLSVSDEGGFFVATDTFTVIVPQPIPPRVSAGPLGTNLHVGLVN